MDRMNQKMKRMNIRGLFDGKRGALNSVQTKVEVGVEESITSEQFQLAKTVLMYCVRDMPQSFSPSLVTFNHDTPGKLWTASQFVVLRLAGGIVRHGFPYQPTCMAYDSVQNLLAIGTKSGSIRIFGRPGVDCHIRHESEPAVIQLMFLINEGALVSVCADDQLHLWSLRQRKPEIVHSLKFQRERITYCHLPFHSKWLYIGTKQGNVHVVNIESFAVSGYIINWNKTIDLLSKNHPGSVVHLSDNQMDPNKLLIGYEFGMLVLWDLKNKVAEFRYNCAAESLKSACWHHEGKQFICCHSDGSISVWNSNSPQQAQSTMMPHAKSGRDGKPDPCRPISKVDLRTVRNGEPVIVFSGGTSQDAHSASPSITVMHGSSTTVLEMEHPIIDFCMICATPWNNDFQDPSAVIVLLQNDLVIVDLSSPGYPCFENPYPMDFHESPVTCCLYFADCPPDLIPAFYSVGCKQKSTGYSEKEWPITGGDWRAATCSYSEIVMTGHADGSVKFWDASAVTLQALYKLKTAKAFDESRLTNSDSARPDPGGGSPLAVRHLHLCIESRLLCVAGASHVLVFKYSKQENLVEFPTIEISIVYDIYSGVDTPETECSRQQMGANFTAGAGDTFLEKKCIRAKSGVRKWSPGYQPDVCCILTYIEGEAPPPITSLTFYAKYGLMAFGNENGVAIIDVVQKSCLMNMGTPDLYGWLDPLPRPQRSSNARSHTKPHPADGLSQHSASDGSKSPVADQPNHAKRHLISPKHSIDPSNIPSAHAFVVDSRRKSSGTDLTANHSQPALHSQVSDVYDEVWSLEATDSFVIPQSPDSTTDRFPNHSNHFIVSPQCDSHCENSGRTRTFRSSMTSADCVDAHESPDAVSRRESLPEGSAAKNQASARSSLSHAPIAVPVRPPPPMAHRRSETEASLSPVSSTTRRSPVSRSSHMPNQTESNVTQPPGDGPPQRASSSDDQEQPTRVRSSDGAGGAKSHRLPYFVRHMRAMAKKKLSWDATADGANGDCMEARRKSQTIQVVDFASDEARISTVQKTTYADIAAATSAQDKAESGLISRSQSSSVSSLDNMHKEAILCLTFADSFARKSDVYTSPSLWVGTSLGSILVVSILLPEDDESRATDSVIAAVSGTIFRLKGSIKTMSFLDCSGILVPSVVEWRETSHDDSVVKDRKHPYYRQQSVANMRVRVSPTSSEELPIDRQFAIVCSDKQARVITLPSQTCAYKAKITETSSVAKADVITIKDSFCLACYLQNGHIMTYSLPSLRPLLDVDHLPFPDARVAQTFCFSINCHALYFCSPSELQKLTLSAEVCEGLKDMLGELFLPRDMPEAPKQGFLKTFFSVGSSTLDREELFGEGSGKASRGVATYTSGMSHAQESAGVAVSDISRARQLAMERGEKLGDTEEATERMKMHAEMYAQSAHQLMNKYKNKKWYQF